MACCIPWRPAVLPVPRLAGNRHRPRAQCSRSWCAVFDEPMLVRGWTTVPWPWISALGYFVARIVFGEHPAVPFFPLLAISANGLGFVALALADPIKEVRLVWP